MNIIPRERNSYCYSRINFTSSSAAGRGHSGSVLASADRSQGESRSRTEWNLSLFLASWLALALIPFAGAQTLQQAVENYNAGKMFEGTQDESLAYRLYVPANYQAQQKYPLLIWLEGGGNRGNDLEGWKQHGPGAFTSQAFQEKTPCFVLAPRCPKGKSMWTYPGSQQGPLAPGLRLTMELLDATMREYNIDPQRLYIAGFSAGGFGTWDAISRYPERFAAAIPISGGGDTNKVAAFVHLPIWAFHGVADNDVPIGRSRKMIAALQALGGSPKFTEFPDTGHVDAVKKAFQDPGVLEWLMAQKREPVPGK